MLGAQDGEAAGTLLPAIPAFPASAAEENACTSASIVMPRLYPLVRKRSAASRIDKIAAEDNPPKGYILKKIEDNLKLKNNNQ